MTKLLIVLAVLFAYFFALAIVPPAASSRFLKLRRESKLWARLIGIMGIIWIALTLAVDARLHLFQLTYRTKTTLTTTRNTLGGVVIGLLLALHTERFDRREVDHGERRHKDHDQRRR